MSDEARRDWRDLLDQMQASPGASVRIVRHGKPVAVLASHELFTAAMYYIANTMDRAPLPDDDVWAATSEILRAGLREIGFPDREGGTT